METRDQRLEAATHLEDPVELSGGPLAGEIVEGKEWAQGTAKEFDVKSKSGKLGIYRRLEDSDDDSTTPDHSVWCGLKI